MFFTTLARQQFEDADVHRQQHLRRNSLAGALRAAVGPTITWPLRPPLMASYRCLSRPTSPLRSSAASRCLPPDSSPHRPQTLGRVSFSAGSAVLLIPFTCPSTSSQRSSFLRSRGSLSIVQCNATKRLISGGPSRRADTVVSHGYIFLLPPLGPRVGAIGLPAQFSRAEHSHQSHR